MTGGAITIIYCEIHDHGFSGWLENIKRAHRDNIFISLWVPALFYIVIPIFGEICNASWIIVVYEVILKDLRHAKTFK